MEADGERSVCVCFPSSDLVIKVKLVSKVIEPLSQVFKTKTFPSVVV